jgi:uncharacterized protein (DUF305 family)
MTLRRLTAGLVAGALLATGAVACGDDGDAEPAAEGTPTDRVFLKAMIAHHEAAVGMARIARKRGEDPQLKRLAAEIVSAQTSEIRQMERIHARLFHSKARPDLEAHDQLGLSASEAGLEHVDHTRLEAAQPFDRAFIDEMVPHHLGAVRMARVVVAKTKDEELGQLARAIIEGQSREIRQMNKWRTRWYEPAPAGRPPGGGPGKGERHEGGHSD